MRKQFLIIFTLLCYVCCQSNHQVGDDQSLEDTQESPPSGSQLVTQEPTKAVYVIDTINFKKLKVTDTLNDDRFSIAPLGLNTKPRMSIPYESIVKAPFKLDSSFVKSHINPSDKYKIIRLQTDRSLLIFIRGLEGDIALDRGQIFDNSVLLANGIRIGMSKEDYLSSMNRKTKKGDVILVKDQDQVYEHLFYFEGDTLAAIELKSVLDY